MITTLRLCAEAADSRSRIASILWPSRGPGTASASVAESADGRSTLPCPVSLDSHASTAGTTTIGNIYYRLSNILLFMYTLKAINIVLHIEIILIEKKLRPWRGRIHSVKKNYDAAMFLIYLSRETLDVCKIYIKRNVYYSPILFTMYINKCVGKRANVITLIFRRRTLDKTECKVCFKPSMGLNR